MSSHPDPDPRPDAEVPSAASPDDLGPDAHEDAVSHTDPTPPGSTRRWVGLRAPQWQHGLALPIGAGVAIGLLAAQAVTGVLGRVEGLIIIVVTSLFLSFAMEPAVQHLARRGMRRGIATGIVFLAGFLLLGGFVAAMTGLVLDQVRHLVASTPNLVSDLAELAATDLPEEVGEPLAEWLDEQQRILPRRITEAVGALGRGALGVGQTVIGGVFQLATIGLVTFYLVADAPRVRFALASRLEPRDQVRVLGLWELAIAKTGGYVYSRFLTAIVSAGFHLVVFGLLGLDYALALGVWVGLISSLIPAIGTYLAGALPVIVALATRPSLALWVLLAIVIYQQIENYLLVPKITATTMELHPVVAFLSVLAGGAIAGVPGALLAIPAVAIVIALLSAATEEYEVLEHTLLETGPARAAALVEQASRPRRSRRRDTSTRRATSTRRDTRATGEPSPRRRSHDQGSAPGAEPTARDRDHTLMEPPEDHGDTRPTP